MKEETQITIYIRKATGDYINDSTGNLCKGKFWEVKSNELLTTMRFPGNISKAALVENLQSNFGQDIIIYQRVA